MDRAKGNLDDDQGEEAGKEQEEALADLEDAQEELEETRREAEEQLAMEQLARMGDRLKSLAERQEKIVSETSSYEAMRQKNDGKLTIAQRAGVKGLGQVQSGLKDETAELIENLEGAPVFALTLRRASQSMEERRQAAGRAQDRRTRPNKPPRRPPIDSSSSWNRSRPTRPAVEEGAAAGVAGAAAEQAVTAAMATASPRPLSSRCSSRSSKKSTTGPKRSTSCSAATRS